MTNEILTLAKSLITIPSVIEEREKAIEILDLAKQHLPAYPFTPFVSEGVPSLLFSNKNDVQKNFTIILNAHLDVVPAGEEQFKPYEKDSKLYGRGAYDMKAAAAVMIVLFKELGQTLPYPLGLQLTTDEEVGGHNGTNYQINNGVTADFCITGEGSNLRIIHASKGRLILKLTTTGKNAHSAYPWLGKNAIWEMYESLGDLMEHYAIPEEETEKTTVNIAKIETTNQTYNKVPDHCVAFLDIRYAAEEKDTIIQTLRSLIPEELSFEVVTNLHPHQSNHESTYITQLQNIGKNLLGKSLSLARAHGGSDASFFSAIGTEAIEFGPIGHGHHGEKEWVDIKSLEEYYIVLKQFLLSIK